ncbi:repressor protein [Niveomyces insectorum RCEF 264]|uniref:Repressor protein n=1 Tax=Niveomyces insectorum RCEF 264 TaxID=1081102 RepID=A0A162MQA7_9HYPO|nr:repressor protein [Niveomyces insectorum RCEF 264]
MAALLPNPPPNTRLFHPDASIVLVGCRGAGKRSLGFIGAMHLRRRLVTEDHYFEQITGETRGQFLGRHGREAFARRSVEVFRQMLDANPRRCVIECGLGSLADDAQAALRVYGETHPVIYVHREREQVLQFLDETDGDQLLRADPSHRQCSNFEYYNLFDPYSGRAPAANDSVGSSSGNSSPWHHHHVQSTHAYSSILGGSGSGTSSTGITDPNTTAGSTNSGSTLHHPSAGASSRLFYAKEDFSRFIDLLQGQTWHRRWAESPFSLNALPPEYRAYSYALRLRLSYLVDMDLEWEDLEARGDCVELIIDHWPDNLFDVIARQVALIRRKLAVPIIYHVEETPREERSRPLAERDRMDAELLELGLRLNVEYLSLDLQRSDALVHRILAQRGRTSIVGNFWHTGLASPPWTAEVHRRNYERARALGCNVVRMARFCTSEGGADEPAKFRASLAHSVPDPRPPLVAYDYSILGLRLPGQSRILSPVKHPDAANRRDHLATVATAATLLQRQFLNGALDALQFYTIGSRIANSITPAIHIAAFAFSGMPHTFRAAECATLADLRRLFLDPGSSGNRTFGGATLAAPFKVAIRPCLARESQHAAALGAVNVLLPLRGGPVGTTAMVDHATARNKAGVCSAFYGDNTDWRSIHTCLQRALSPRNGVQPSRTTGLVIGAGGMARAAIYALLRLGCRHIFICNRTPQHAFDVAKHFNDWAAHNLGQQASAAAQASAPVNGHSSNGNGNSNAHGHNHNNSHSSGTICHVLQSTADPWPAEFQPPTMVISCVPAINADGSPAADFEMPRQWLGSPTGGVVVELAYEPLITPLVSQMQLWRDAAAPAWVVVDGLEVVSEMAIEAFELLTGRMAPQRLMKSVCRRVWSEQQQQQQHQHHGSSSSAFETAEVMTDGP